jgi:hypothetical protein
VSKAWEEVKRNSPPEKFALPLYAQTFMEEEKEMNNLSEKGKKRKTLIFIDDRAEEVRQKKS